MGISPLALHGIVVTKPGRSVDIVIGEDPQDPVFTIPDLLPHLDKKKFSASVLLQKY